MADISITRILEETTGAKYQVFNRDNYLDFALGE